MKYEKLGDGKHRRNSTINFSTANSWPSSIIHNSKHNLFTIIIEDNSLKNLFEDYFKKQISANIRVYHSAENTSGADGKLKGKKIIIDTLSNISLKYDKFYLVLLDLDYDKILKNKDFVAISKKQNIIFTKMYSVENYFFNFNLLKSQLAVIGDKSQHLVNTRLDRDKDLFVDSMVDFYYENLPKILALHLLGKKTIISRPISEYINMSSSTLIELKTKNFFNDIILSLNSIQKATYDAQSKKFKADIDTLIIKHGKLDAILPLIPGKRLLEHFLYYSSDVFDDLVECINKSDPNCTCSRCFNRMDLRLDTKNFLVRYLYNPNFNTPEFIEYFNSINDYYKKCTDSK